MAELRSLGVTGTPAFFFNGHFLNGAKPFQEFAKLINAELQRLNLPIPPAATAQAVAPAPPCLVANNSLGLLAPFLGFLFDVCWS